MILLLIIAMTFAITKVSDYSSIIVFIYLAMSFFIGKLISYADLRVNKIMRTLRAGLSIEEKE